VEHGGRSSDYSEENDRYQLAILDQYKLCVEIRVGRGPNLRGAPHSRPPERPDHRPQQALVLRGRAARVGIAAAGVRLRVVLAGVGEGEGARSSAVAEVSRTTNSPSPKCVMPDLTSLHVSFWKATSVTTMGGWRNGRNQ
jgi:hypothetical protein